MREYQLRVGVHQALFGNVGKAAVQVLKALDILFIHAVSDMVFCADRLGLINVEALFCALIHNVFKVGIGLKISGKFAGFVKLLNGKIPVGIA